MNRIWSKLGKLFGGLLLFGGGTLTAGLLLGMVVSHASGVLLAVLWVLTVVMGLVPLALGGWLLYASSKAAQQAIREQFFDLLRLHQGRLSVLDFAAATRLEPTIARRYLDGWAKEFDAEFEVCDKGEVYYVFANQPAALPETNLQLLGQALRQWLQSTV